MTDLSRIPVAILVGGLGTRLRTALSDRPKCLAPIAGKPFITYLLDKLDQAGFRRVVMCTGHLAEQVEADLGDAYAGLSLSYSVEDRPLGTGGALRLAAESLPDGLVLVLNGDSYTDVEYGAFVRWAEGSAPGPAVVVVRVDDAGRYGNVRVTEDDAVMAFEEKGGAESGWINAGIYLLPRSLLMAICGVAAVSLEREVLPTLVGRGLMAFRCHGRFLDIGTPDDFARAEDFLQEQTC